MSELILHKRPNPCIDKPAVTIPGTRRHEVNYVQPKKVFRSEINPILSDMAGTVVAKASWPEIGRRANEAEMYNASDGRFGTTPHACSYEGVGVYGEVISNTLFLPRQEDIAKHHWPILRQDTPTRTDHRTLWITALAAEGQSLVRAKSPHQLSRAWVHSILGAFVTVL